MRWRRTPTGLTLLASALVAVAVGAAGCASSADPAPSPSASTSTSTSSGSPTPSATPSPSDTPTIPAAARQQTPEGAEAFVRYFVDQSALAWTEPNPRLITALSDPDCDSCTSLADTATQLEKKGQHYEDVPISVATVQALAGDGSRINVAASIIQHEVDVVDKEGDVVKTDQSEELDRTFLLYWKDGQWLVGGIA